MMKKSLVLRSKMNGSPSLACVRGVGSGHSAPRRRGLPIAAIVVAAAAIVFAADGFVATDAGTTIDRVVKPASLSETRSADEGPRDSEAAEGASLDDPTTPLEGASSSESLPEPAPSSADVVSPSSGQGDGGELLEPVEPGCASGVDPAPPDPGDGNPSSAGHEHEWVQSTKVVHHDAVHRTIVHDPVYEKREWTQCNVCQQDISGEAGSHSKQHMLAGEGSGWHTETDSVLVSPGFEEKVLVEGEWEEEVVDGSVCSSCGVRG